MAKNWIKGAIKHPGALRTKAKAKHLVTGTQTLTNNDLGILAKHANATTKKEVSLAKTLKGFSRGN